MYWTIALAAVSALAAQNDTQPAAIRVLIVTGYDHPAHDWKTSGPTLREVLEQDGRFEVRLVEDPEFLGAAALRDYDVVLLHFMNWKRPDPGPRARENLQAFVESGKGLVVLHFACGAFGDWDEYRNLAGRIWDKENSHDPRGPFQVEITGQAHPITRGLKSYETDDELYICLTGERPIQVLATARSRITRKDHPMAFCFDFGKGRVFHTSLGHDARALRVAGTAELLRRGAAWVAGHEAVAE